tara:strand:+ start:18 stop:560 length:543 start_codon:yes stop_codon:yes gene_type:complete
MDFLLYLNTWLDYLVLLILITSVLIGFSRGLYMEIISNAIWIGALAVAWIFRFYPMDIFKNLTDDKEMRSIFSFVSIFIVLWIVFRIIGKALIRGISTVQKGVLDRIFGATFGALRGALIIIVVFLVGETYIMQQQWWTDSYMSDYILSAADYVGSLVGRVPLEDLNAEELNLQEDFFEN